ncbi:hypothetical protein Adt_42793 [Abeliophyllum distichum]|uniref:Uncharacterized protein n=1 Tax=Abeliophyllum distichum TaxID=126358 RepID=A0ABD1PTM0_9LAMI
MFEYRKKDEDEDDFGQSITIQFGNLSLVMASNYLLANKFKNKESDVVILKETAEIACVLECGEGTSNRGQVTHEKSEEEGDGMIDIEEEIDLEAERRIMGVLYNNLLRHLYQKSNQIVDLFG